VITRKTNTRTTDQHDTFHVRSAQLTARECEGCGCYFRHIADSYMDSSHLIRSTIQRLADVLPDTFASSYIELSTHLPMPSGIQTVMHKPHLLAERGTS
jgi:hypothetical protein